MDYRLPDLGEGIHEAELADWRVRPGEAVRRGATIAEVMTDKAVIELPASFDGTVSELLAEPGATIAVGTPILRYTSDEAATDETDETDETDSDSLSPVRGGEGRGEEAGDLQRPKRLESGLPSPPTSLPGGEGSRKTRTQDERPAASPAVRRMARSLGVDLAGIAGSGAGGRILIEDLAQRVKSAVKSASNDQPARNRVDGAATAEFGRPGTRQPFRGLRRKIAERMVHSKHTIPHYAYVDECDVSELVRLRNGLRETFSEQGVRLTYLAFFVRAVVGALREVPLLNATLDEQAGEVVLYDHYHVGIATSTPQGLIVPVLRDADRLDLRETARGIERLSAAARAQRLTPEELRGGTFTVTSIGGIGGLISTPIVNHPEVGILGIGRIVRRPVYDESGALRPADLVYLSFSFDHRVIDGAVGAAFGNAVIRRLTNPAPLLLPPERRSADETADNTETNTTIEPSNRR
jgi:pyruvate dehydrogenase E2 component (dihydrolipoamide acetyltransferase)/2-oxoisovalerate dehydrogenase E2 component (dihydrolipoyl transacylase)